MRKRVNRTTARWGALGAIALVFSSGVLPPVQTAEAQYYQRRSILDFLLGRRYIDQYPPAPNENAAPPRGGPAVPQKKSGRPLS